MIPQCTNCGQTQLGAEHRQCPHCGGWEWTVIETTAKE